MNYEFKGKLKVKNETIQVSDKFKKREFVLEKTEVVGQSEFTDYVKFELTQDKCNLIDNINLGEEITVHFNLRGNEWTKEGKTNYFTNLQVWKIDGATSSNNAQVQNDVPPPSAEDEPDDLPF